MLDGHQLRLLAVLVIQSLPVDGYEHLSERTLPYFFEDMPFGVDGFFCEVSFCRHFYLIKYPSNVRPNTSIILSRKDPQVRRSPPERALQQSLEGPRSLHVVGASTGKVQQEAHIQVE